jgi:hypothetical protein
MSGFRFRVKLIKEEYVTVDVEAADYDEAERFAENVITSDYEYDDFEMELEDQELEDEY